MLEITHQRISQTAQRCVCVSSSLVNRCGVSYTQEYSIHGCQSGTWSQSGMKVKRVTLCHSGHPLLKQTGIRVATKPFPGPTTREHRELVSIKTISCGTSSSVYCLECVCVLPSHLFWMSGLWTHEPGSHRRNVTQGFTTFLRAASISESE